MNLRQKSQRGFVAVTLITVLSIALVLIVYATLLGTFPGGEVTVGGVAGASITYSPNDAEAGPWNPTLTVGGTTTPWYTRIQVTSGDYEGPTTITWQLQKKTDEAPTWTNVGTAETTQIVLTGTGQIIYVKSDGSPPPGNFDWSTKITGASETAGTYRVYVTIDSA